MSQSVAVHLPSNLYRYVGERRQVEASGATLREVLADLERRHPGLRFRVVDEQDRIRPHIRMFVGGDSVAHLDVPVARGQEVHILGALSGG